MGRNGNKTIKIISKLVTTDADGITAAGTWHIYRIKRSPDWIEDTSNWNTYDGNNGWTTAGCKSSVDDYDDNDLANKQYCFQEMRD